MSKVLLVSIFTVAIGCGVVYVLHAAPQKDARKAADRSGSLLSGTVRASAGEAMEGITVSARAEGSTITTSVFTDQDGLYIFPPLEPGKYQVWAQTVGYDTAHAKAELSANAAHQDFVLKTAKDVTKQMTGADWFASLPEETISDRRIKDVFKTSCTGCHIPAYILQNRFDTAGWSAIINLMKMVNVNGIYSGPDAAPWPIIEYHKKELADYLAKARGPQPSSMKVKLLSRPKGDATLAVITEYAIDLAVRPGEYPSQDGNDWSEGVPSKLNGVGATHDGEIDFAGNMWVGNNQASETRTYAKIDAKTGQVTSYKVLNQKGKVRTSHGMRKDANGMLWFNLSGASRSEEGELGSLARLDPMTGKLDVFTPPNDMSGIGGAIDVDGKGKIWASTRIGAIRFDPDTGKFMEFKSPHFETEAGTGTTYGVAADADGNGYWAEMSLDIVCKGDVATGKTIEIQMPPQRQKMEIATAEERKLYGLSGSDWNSAIPWTQGPRRLSGDHTGNAVWVGNWWGENLAKIDTRTLKVTMYPVPNKHSGPYATVIDKNHVVWVNMMNNDSVGRFDPATEKWTEYMLPTHGAETRHISVNDREYPPTVVVPYERTSKMGRLQFRTREQLQALKDQVQNQSLQAENR